MRSTHGSSAVFGNRTCLFLKLGAEVIIFTLLFAGVQARSIASSDVENENQIHEFHKHLPRYNHKGEDLRALADKAPDKTVHSVSAPPAVGIISTDGPNGELLFDTDLCRADATVIGTITTFKTFLSADNSTVFTDHKIVIEKIIENRSAVPLQVGKPVILTLNGGTFLGDGLKIEQVGFDRPGPLIPSRKYLFLLKSLSNATSVTTSCTFAIEYIDDTGLHVISEDPLRAYVNRFLQTFSPDSMEQHVRQAVMKCSSVEHH